MGEYHVKNESGKMLIQSWGSKKNRFVFLSRVHVWPLKSTYRYVLQMWILHIFPFKQYRKK